MKRFISLLAVVFVSFAFITGCDEDNPASGGGGSPILGTWTLSMAEMGMETTMKFNSDNTFEQTMDMAGMTLFEYSGTWTATSSEVTLTYTSCKDVDMETGELVTGSCDSATDTMPINISGNSWTVPDEETGMSYTYTKQ